MLSKEVIAYGWKLSFFYLFAKIITDLESSVSKLKKTKSDRDFKKHPQTKLLAKVYKSITEIVPSIGPDNKIFRLGKNVLGTDYKSFKRVKDSLPPRYRLFFRFNSTKSVIIYIWLNIEDGTLRKDGDKNDVYEVFKKMLIKGTVPETIEDLLAKASSPLA